MSQTQTMEELQNELAYWQIKSFETQQNIEQFNKSEEMQRQQTLSQIQKQLVDGQTQLKRNLIENVQLKEQNSVLSDKESEQVSILEVITTSQADTEKQLNEFIRNTRMQDDHSKFSTAVQNIQAQQTDLNDLTKLTLQISEQMGHAQIVAAQTQ